MRIYERPQRGTMLRGMAGGYVINTLLPLHLGDIFRAVFVGRRMKSGVGFALATVIMDRFLDVWFVALGFAAFALAGPEGALRRCWRPGCIWLSPWCWPWPSWWWSCCGTPSRRGVPGRLRHLQRYPQAGRHGLLLEPHQHLQGPAPGESAAAGGEHRHHVGSLSRHPTPRWPAALTAAGQPMALVDVFDLLFGRSAGDLRGRAARRHPGRGAGHGAGAAAGLVFAAAGRHVAGHPAARGGAGGRQQATAAPRRRKVT